ncbi:MAG TPA: hypothetical protein V6C58_25260 [Allocoleopsis sp.]
MAKTKDTEKLTPDNIERVIKHLENKGTKKDACQILGINYNTTRLDSIITKYLERKADDAKRKAEKRGKPATSGEIAFVIQSYLEGKPVDSIANSIYRGPTFVTTILDNCGVPRRQRKYSYNTPELVPEEAIRESFSVGQVVYSMRYDCLAKIRNILKPGVYGIILKGEDPQCAYQPVEELAGLDHLEKLGVKF